MFFENRVYQVIQVGTPDDLAQRLKEMTLCLCAAFQCGDLLLVNDSTSEDGAQEYAAIRGGRLIDSITVSWCQLGDLVRILGELHARAGGDYGPAPVRLDHPAGPCAFCE
jgi:hypothetical protein